ncbi:MAG: hypothetical protein GX085_02800 [Firmicutes bacterium]|nr:hypothetical protein [Bacillota bacterium]
MELKITAAKTGGSGRKICLAEDEKGEKYLLEALELTISSEELFFLEFLRDLRETIRRLPAPHGGSLLTYLGVERVGEEYYLVLPFHREVWEYWPRSGTIDFTLKEVVGAGEAMGEALRFFSEQDEFPQGFFYTDLIPLGVGRVGVLDPRVQAMLAPYREDANGSARELREGFRPPEIIKDAPWDEKANLYTIGLTMYYLATGVYPFPLERKEETAAAILKEEPLDPRYYHPKIGGGLAVLLQALLAKEPVRRPGLQEFFTGIRELYYQDRFLATAGEEESFAGEGARARRRLEQKRRAYRWWTRAKWPVLILLPLLVLFYFFSRPGYEEVVTPETTPEEVVAYFYQSLAAIDHVLLEQTVTGEAGKEYINLTTVLHVISKTRMIYEGARFPFIVVEDLMIVPEEDSPAERPSFRSSFRLKFVSGEEYTVQERRERLFLERVKFGRQKYKWQIVEVQTEILSEKKEPVVYGPSMPPGFPEEARGDDINEKEEE